MPEFLFYRLEMQPLQAVLPVLLEKTLERGWRACLRFSSAERLDAIDSALWTYREDSFLPHGRAQDGYPEKQPIYLTLDHSVPNKAQVLFLLEDAEELRPERFERIVRLFGGGDETATAKARAEWQNALRGGHSASFWVQDDKGRWQRAH